MINFNTCNHCSSPISTNSKYCAECGYKIESKVASQEQVVESEENEGFLQSKSWQYIQLLLGFLILVIAGAYFLSPKTTSAPKLNYETIKPMNQEYDSGMRACDLAGEATANGKYVCLGGVWVEWQVQDVAPARQGRWITNCINVKVPNPNYDARKGFSAFVNEPYVNQEQCNQAYVYE